MKVRVKSGAQGRLKDYDVLHPVLRMYADGSNPITLEGIDQRGNDVEVALTIIEAENVAADLATLLKKWRAGK